jgi:hypothetical protein
MVACEFISYEPVTGQNYLGIVTIKRHGDYHRLKWVARKDGKGEFSTACSIKRVDGDGEKWLECFVIDSRYEQEQVEQIIRKCVNEALNHAAKPMQMSGSALQPPNMPDVDPGECPF